MNFFPTIVRRLRSLWQRSAVKREIDEELRFHIEQRGFSTRLFLKVSQLLARCLNAKMRTASGWQPMIPSENRSSFWQGNERQRNDFNQCLVSIPLPFIPLP
jgi:hypothetical protein